MTTGSKIGIGLGIGFILIISLIVGIYFNAKFTAEKHENGIEAIYSEMQNVYANSIVQTLEAKSDVIGKYKGDLLEIVKANMERYKNDENLLFKSVAEQANLTLSTDLYKDISKSIEIGYQEFKNSQQQKIDRVRVYKNFLNGSFSGMIAKMAGYPSETAKIVMDKLITNDATSKTFATGKMEKLDLFGKDK